MEDAAKLVFDDLLKRWDREIYAAEWVRMMAQLEEVFLGASVAEPSDKRRAIANGMHVARTSSDWQKILEFLAADPAALHPNDQAFFFSGCPEEVFVNFVVSDDGGLFSTALNRLNKSQMSTGSNNDEEIRLLHFSYDALEFLVSKDGDWKPKFQAAVDLMNRLCLLKGRVPGSLREKFDRVLAPPAPAPEEQKTINHNPVAARPVMSASTGPARTLRVGPKPPANRILGDKLKVALSSAVA